MLLEVSDLEVAYGDYQVVWGVSLSVAAGETKFASTERVSRPDRRTCGQVWASLTSLNAGVFFRT